jgi:hypothetical protein
MTRGFSSDQKSATDGSNKPSVSLINCGFDVNAIKMPFKLGLLPCLT